MEMEHEVMSIEPTKLRKLRDFITEVFSKIGTEKSRQRLIYDLLNTIKTDNRKRFLELVLKNINKSDDENKAKLTELLSSLYLEYETPENFEKIAYAVVMGIMSIKNVGGGGEDD